MSRVMPASTPLPSEPPWTNAWMPTSERRSQMILASNSLLAVDRNPEAAGRSGCGSSALMSLPLKSRAPVSRKTSLRVTRLPARYCALRTLMPAITLRPLAPGDESELLRIHETREVMRWWDRPAPGFPWDEPESTRLTIVLDGAIAGLVQYSEEDEPKYRHAGIDLFV